MTVQWQHLMTTYITPSAPREINIPPAVRAELLEFANIQSPPSPDLLEAPVQSMHQLINDSVLAPFLNECSRKHRTTSLSAPSLVSTLSISPTENFDNRKTKRCPSADNKLGKKLRGANNKNPTNTIEDSLKTVNQEGKDESSSSVKRKTATRARDSRMESDPMGHEDIKAICQNNAETIAAGNQGLNVSRDSDKHVGNCDRLFHLVMAKNPFKSLKK